MKTSLPNYFKLIFLAGITLLFVSMFVEWYSFQMFENGRLMVSWNYNIFFEWSTEFPSGITINERYKPENLDVSPILNFLFIIILIFTIYTVLFKDLEQSEDLDTLKNFSFGFICLIALVLFYITIFPVIYLVSNELYFPSLVENDLDLALRFSYSISYGYILQLIGFLLIFPYSMHYYITITQFEKQKNTPEKKVAAYIENIQESIDFDKYIAEEEAFS